MAQWLLGFVFILLFHISFANNTTNVPECKTNDDCATDRVCAKEACVNPCNEACRPHTLCYVKNHLAMCSCIPGLQGHPFIRCYESNITECTTNDDCTADRVCEKQACVDPCDGVCGPHTLCHVKNHVAMCSCIPGHQGHPFTGCSASTDAHKLPECFANDQCNSTKVCIKSKCDDPCEGLCGPNATCTVHSNIPACACMDGHTGDPFLGCSRKDEEKRNLFNAMFKKFHIYKRIGMTWQDALGVCLEKGLYMASIESIEQQAEFNKAVEKVGVTGTGYYGKMIWLSGRKDHDWKGDHDETYYHWIGSGKPLTYTNWNHDKNEPDSLRGNKCMCIDYEPYVNKWGLFNCYIPKDYVACHSFTLM